MQKWQQNGSNSVLDIHGSSYSSQTPKANTKCNLWHPHTMIPIRSWACVICEYIMEDVTLQVYVTHVNDYYMKAECALIHEHSECHLIFSDDILTMLLKTCMLVLWGINVSLVRVLDDCRYGVSKTFPSSPCWHKWAPSAEIYPVESTTAALTMCPFWWVSVSCDSPEHDLWM